jgi:hypothetical protein
LIIEISWAACGSARQRALGIEHPALARWVRLPPSEITALRIKVNAGAADHVVG